MNNQYNKSDYVSYQKNQKVMVRTDNNSKLATYVGWCENMADLNGEIVTITSVIKYGGEPWMYKIAEDTNQYTWQHDQFIPVEITKEKLLHMLLRREIDDEQYKIILEQTP
jgi:hypothetical protein